MNEITVREMAKEEAPLLVKYLYEHRKTNQVDLSPFRANQVRVYVAEDNTGILAFFPIQYIYMYGALAPQPGLEPFRLARACAAITEHLKKQAVRENISTVVLLPSDARFSAFLQNELGYEPVSRETLQMKFNYPKTETA